MAVEAKTFDGRLGQEGDAAEHLMLDPRPREEMNQMVMESMTSMSLRYRPSPGCSDF